MSTVLKIKGEWNGIDLKDKNKVDEIKLSLKSNKLRKK